MACLTKDGSSQGQSSGAEFVSKAPSKTLIIPGKELVQVIAKVCYILFIHNVISVKFCNVTFFFLLLNKYVRKWKLNTDQCWKSFRLSSKIR